MRGMPWSAIYAHAYINTPTHSSLHIVERWCTRTARIPHTFSARHLCIRIYTYIHIRIVRVRIHTHAVLCEIPHTFSAVQVEPCGTCTDGASRRLGSERTEGKHRRARPYTQPRQSLPGAQSRRSETRHSGVHRDERRGFRRSPRAPWHPCLCAREAKRVAYGAHGRGTQRCLAAEDGRAGLFARAPPGLLGAMCWGPWGPEGKQ